MGYAAWSVVFGEQPTAAKWNTLGTNDASFNDGTGIANLEIGSGHTSVKLDYKFSAYRNAAQNTGNNAFAVLQCDTKNYDTGSNLDIVTNKGRFTAPIAGFYYFTGMVQALLSGAGAMGIALYKNGVRTTDGEFQSSTAFANTANSSFVVSDILQLAANDYVEVQVFGSTTIALYVTGGISSSRFSGFLVSAT